MAKKWGQHFLIRQSYVDQLLETAQVASNDCILEIGPGKGILTRALLARQATVTAIEVDPYLYSFLSEQFIREKAFFLFNRDFIECEMEFLANLYPSAYKVVSNLPYNIATPVFFKLLELRHCLQSITVMMQKEVALRICATVNERAFYGVLSVVAELGFERKLSFSIPPSAFYPVPKVDSAVVCLIPKPGRIPTEEERFFLKWVHLVFNHRRKTLLNNLQRCCPEEFKKHEFYLRKKYAKKRAETLTLQELMDLFQLLFHPTGLPPSDSTIRAFDEQSIW